MHLADLLSGPYATDLEESWERERTATPVRVFAIRLHTTGCSLRETLTILHFREIRGSAVYHGFCVVGILNGCAG